MDYKLCRFCYERQAHSNIFQSESIRNKIMYCCQSLVIQENDGLPIRICSTCDRELEACYQFLLKVTTSERKLRSILAETQTTFEVDVPKVEVKSEDTDDDSHLADNHLLSFEHFKNKHEKFTVNKITSKKKPRKKTLKTNNHICLVCTRKCSSASALAIHMRIHTNEKPYQCSSCIKKYKDSGSLKRHVERNHMEHRERRFICENCGKGFYSKSDITIHMRVHTGETPYCCSVCFATFTQLSAMLRHKKRHTGTKTHVCPTCGKLFWTKEELKKHYSVHDNIKQFECPICNVQFKHKGNIKKHMAIHANPNRYVCNHCGQTFNLKGNLKSHISRKHSEKSGYCNICCKNVSDIEIHMWRHTGQRPLQCQLCPSSFYEMKALALHINFKHKRTDRFKCTMEGCTLGFPSKPMRTYHIARFHDMHTLYPCERCSRSFYRKNDLSRHMIGTHKERLL